MITLTLLLGDMAYGATRSVSTMVRYSGADCIVRAPHTRLAPPTAGATALSTAWLAHTPVDLLGLGTPGCSSSGILAILSVNGASRGIILGVNL